MIIPIQDIIFYAFAGLLTCAGLMVVIARDTVHAALFLVLAFFAAAGLWLLIQAEFLALILVLVYVGAVMTLFLFVVMTLNIRVREGNHRWLRYSPFILLAVACMVSVIVYVTDPAYFAGANATPLPATDNNTAALGKVLYTQYAYAFELAGVLLLVAIIAAITLASPVHRQRKIQVIADQVAVRAADRVHLVDLT